MLDRQAGLLELNFQAMTFEIGAYLGQVLESFGSNIRWNIALHWGRVWGKKLAVPTLFLNLLPSNYGAEFVAAQEAFCAIQSEGNLWAVMCQGKYYVSYKCSENSKPL